MGQGFGVEVGEAEVFAAQLGLERADAGFEDCQSVAGFVLGGEVSAAGGEDEVEDLVTDRGATRAAGG